MRKKVCIITVLTLTWFSLNPWSSGALFDFLLALHTYSSYPIEQIGIDHLHVLHEFCYLIFPLIASTVWLRFAKGKSYNSPTRVRLLTVVSSVIAGSLWMTDHVCRAHCFH
jgi:hypothetical protein